MRQEGTKVARGPRVGEVSVTRPPVFKGVEAPSVAKMSERMEDILEQLKDEKKLSMKDFQTIFVQYSKSHIYGALRNLLKKGLIFTVPEEYPLKYTTKKSICEELENKESARIATIMTAGTALDQDVVELDTVKTDHALIRGTVGYDVISKVDIEDMPAVMRFLKILSKSK